MKLTRRQIEALASIADGHGFNVNHHPSTRVSLRRRGLISRTKDDRRTLCLTVDGVAALGRQCYLSTRKGTP